MPSTRTRLLDCISGTESGRGANGSPLLLLDLTLWHKWHKERRTLPQGWGDTVADAARALGTPAWAPFKPWRTEYHEVEVAVEETADQRDITYRVGERTLLARWTRGPDGDWWQTEYPVKTLEDLQAAVEVAADRRYVLDPTGLSDWRAAVDEQGLVPLELPMCPYSDILHTLVGWSHGLTLLMGEGKPLVAEIVASLQKSLAHLVKDLAGLDGDVLLAPDNLDGQYISPRAFKEHLAPSYSATAEVAHRCGRRLVVHVGGPARRLIPLLAQAGVAAVEGVAGAPQGDATLAEAREAAGPAVTLWGGIPQDLLLSEHTDEEFESAVSEAIEEARSDASGRVILGIADRVPVHADIGRLRRLVERLG